MEEDYNFALGERDARKFLIGGINGQVGIDRTDSLLDPTRGFRAQILVQANTSVLAQANASPQNVLTLLGR